MDSMLGAQAGISLARKVLHVQNRNQVTNLQELQVPPTRWHQQVQGQGQAGVSHRTQNQFSLPSSMSSSIFGAR